jgi:branched-chain amino acid transport system permease protein
MSRVRWWLALGALAPLAAAPAVLPGSLLAAAVQMLVAALFASAFNVLAGQGGMLSFGHAAYFGVGAFATLHAMGGASGAPGLLPTPLLPLAGGLAGLLMGLLAGWFSTRRSGVYFSMITLALAELLHALAPHLKAVFGGESGISAMRLPAWGFSFGDTAHVYWLTLAWVIISLAALWGITRTPFGRITLALRENDQRLGFLGYHPHRLKVLAFAVSAAFSGVAGGLQVLNSEAANYELFDIHVSSVVVLNTYIGGTGAFLGPALGAAVMTFFGYAMSDVTRSWMLYQGVLFVFVMMYVPDGFVGLVQRMAVAVRLGHGWWLARRAALTTVAATLLAAAAVFGVEVLQRLLAQDYQAQRSLAGGAWPALDVFGRSWNPVSLVTWAVPLLLAGAGAAAELLARRTALLSPDAGVES